MSEPTLVIVGRDAKRQRGRPRAFAEPGVSVKTWLQESEYDRLIRVAKERREPVSSLVRSLLISRLP